MSHLSAERLAALADAGERPTTPEAEHLARCAACADEREAFTALVADARAERTSVGAPLTEWSSLAAALRTEGLVAVGGRRSAVGAASSTPRDIDLATRRRVFRRTVQVAAGFAIMAVGLTMGRLTAIVGPYAVASTASSPLETPTADRRPPIAFGSEFVPAFRSVGEAQAALEQYEVAYQHAAAFLADRDPAAHLGSPDDYRTRLVALERAGRTMREAMEDAPYDPVITGYYLTTLGQREATLRQLNVALPATQRLNSF